MCDCVQHDLGPFHWISIYVSIQGRGGGIQVHCIWYNRCDNIWLLFSLAGTQTHVWIDLATGCTSIVFFFRLATNLTGTCMSF